MSASSEKNSGACDNAQKESPGVDSPRSDSSQTARPSTFNREIALKRRVLLSPVCVEVLREIKEIKTESTFGELLDTLKLYILSRKLLDPKDQSQTHILADDGFRKLFGVADFSVTNLSALLTKILKFVDPGVNISNFGCSPTRNAGSSTASNASASTGGCSFRRSASPMYLPIPGSPDYRATSSDPDSIQGYVTEFVKDSTDEEYYSSDDAIPMPSFIAVRETIEYEIESDSDSKNEFLNHNDRASTSGEEQNLEEIIVVKKSDSDIEFFADESSKEDDHSDPEISKVDKWNCKYCNAFNKPWIRFCCKCWKTRSGWVPRKRPERRKPRRKRKSKKPSEKRKRSGLNPLTFNVPSTSQENFFNSDSGIETLKTSDYDKPGTSQASDSGYVSGIQGMSQDIQGTSQESLSIYDMPSTSQDTSLNYPSASQSSSQPGPSQVSSQESKTSDLICMICCTRKPNAAILHAKFVHTNFLCFDCGTKLYLGKQRCPVCRRTIEKVLRNVDVSY